MGLFYKAPYRTTARHAGRWWLPGLGAVGTTEMVTIPAAPSPEGMKFSLWLRELPDRSIMDSLRMHAEEAGAGLISIPKAIYDMYEDAKVRLRKMIEEGCIPLDEWDAKPIEQVQAFGAWWQDNDPSTYAVVSADTDLRCISRKAFEYWQAYPDVTTVPEEIFGHEKAFAHTTLGQVSLFGAAAVAGYYVMKAMTKPVSSGTLSPGDPGYDTYALDVLGIKRGDIVKVTFPGEAIWVKLTSVDVDKMQATGTFDNHPIVLDAEYGDSVTFPIRDIVQKHGVPDWRDSIA